MPSNQIKFDIKFNTDMTDMRAVQQNLQTLQNLKLDNLIDPTQFKDASLELTRINEVARITEQALQRTFDIDMGTANLRDFQQQLKKNGLTIGDVEREFLKLGNQGELAFMQVQRAVSGVNYELKTAHPMLEKIGKTLGNTIRYQIATTAINKFTGSIQSAYSFAQKLDKSLNNIRIVTEKSSDEMANFAIQSNKAAKALGASTTDYTNAALIYYQQGLSDAEVKARTDVTVKVANITKQSADAVSEQLTAVWNGYKVTAEEAELYIDKLSAVAASSASDLEELATGMSRVASAAAAMGINIDQLTAQISTIVSVTRQDAASVGTALKTIYARMGDLAVQGEDEFGVALGDVSGKLQTMGINVLDQMGNLRDMGDVIEEVAGKWGTWTEAQQQAAAVALAGKRQYNNLIALFENWDMYSSSMEVSKGSAGTLQKQQDIYLDSLEAHLEKVNTAAERLYNSLFDSDSFKEFLDVITWTIDRLGSLVDVLGGGGHALMYFGSIMMNMFSAKIGQFFGTMANNIIISQENLKNYNAELKKAANLAEEAKRAQDALEKDPSNKNLQKQAEATQFNAQHAENNIRISKAARSGVITEDRAQELRRINDQVRDTRQNRLSAIVDEDASNKAQLERAKKITELFGEKEDLINPEEQTKNIRKLAEELQEEIKTATQKGIEAGTPLTPEAIEQIKEDFKKAHEDDYKQIEQIGTAPGGGYFKEQRNQLTEVAKDSEGFSELKRLGITEEEIDIIAKARIETKAWNEIISATEQETVAWNEAFHQSGTEAQNYYAILKKVAQAEGLSGKALKGRVTSLADAAVKQKKNSQTLTELIQKIKEYNTSIGKTDTQLDALFDEYQSGLQGSDLKLIEYLKNDFNDLEETLSNTGTQLVDTIEDGAEAMDKGTEAQEHLNKEMGNLPAQELGQKISTITSGIMAIASAANTVKNIINVWGDDSVSTGEKISQTVMGLLSLLPILIPVIKGISVAFKSASVDAGAAGAAGAAAGAGMIAAGTGAATGTPGVVGFGTALWTALAPILPIIAAVVAGIAVLVALFAGISALIKANYERTHAARIENEKATKAYEAQVEILNSLKQAYEKLKESIEDYHEAQNAIDELTTGTEEWKEAIEDANEKVLELVSSYGELANYVTTDVNGRMTISDEGLELVTSAKKEQLNNQKRNTLIAQARKNETSVRASAEQYFEDSKNLGSFIYYDAIMNAINNDKLATANEETFAEALAKELDASTEEVKKVSSLIYQDIDILKKNAQEIKANTAANKLLNRQIADSTLSDNIDYQGTEYKDLIQDIVTEEADKAYLDTTNWLTMENSTLMQEYSKYDSSSKDYEKDVAKDYATYLGEGYTADGGSVIGPDGQKIEMSADEMIRNMAKGKAFERASLGIEERIKEVETTVQKIDEITEGAGYIILQATKDLPHDINTLNEAQIKAIQDNLNNLTEEQKKGAQKILDEYKAEIDEILYANNDFVRNAFKSFTENRKDISLAGQKNIAESFAKAFRAGGQQGIEEATKFLNQYSGEELEKVAGIFQNIDWSKSGADNLFRQGLEDAGIELKNLDNIYSSLIQTFNKSRSGLTDLTTGWKDLKTQIEEVYKLTKDLKLGSIISEDDYKSLIKYKEELKDYFILTKEGYKLVKGSGKDLEEIANSSIKPFEEYNRVVNSVNTAGKDLNKKKLNLSTKEKVVPDSKTLSTLLGDESYKDILSAAGMSQEELQEYYKKLKLDDKVTEDNLKSIAEALGLDYTQEDVKSLQNKLNQAQQNAIAAVNPVLNNLSNILNQVEYGGYKLSDEQQQLIASQATSFDELRSLKEVGLTEENYKKVRKSFIIDELDDLDLSISSWDAWAENLDEATQEAALSTLKAAAAFREIDITADVSNQIDTLTNSLSKLQAQAEKTYDKGLIDNLTKQAEIQEDLIKAEKEKLRLLQEQEKTFKAEYKLQENMAKSLLSNYDVLTNGELDYEKISKLYTTLEDENLKDGINQWMDAYQQYHEVEMDLADQEVKIQDAVDSLYDTNLQKYDLKIQLEIDTKQAERDFYDFMQKTYKGGLAEDDFAGAAGYAYQNALTYFNGQGGGQLMTNMTGLRDAMIALNAAENQLTGIYAGPYKDADGTINTADAEAARQKYLEAARSDAETLMNLFDSAVDNYISAMDDISDKFSKQMDTYTRIQSRITHDMNLIKLIYGETAYSRLEDYYNAQQQTYLSSLQMAKDTVNYWTETLSKISDKESEQYKTAQEKLNEAIEQRDSMLEEALSNMAEKYTNTIEAIVQEFISGITGGEGLDLLNEKWEAANGQAERYLDVINASYQIQKLESKYNDSIDNLKDNVSLQKRLNDLKNKELSYLREKNKLSQYDIDRANLLYELELKRIELEEAQQNKVKMKLTRDASGNYSYQFVADEEATSKLEQELADLENQLYNLDVEEYRSQTDNMLSAVQEFTDKIKNAYAISDELERNNMLNAIKEEYIGVNGVFSDLGMSMNTVTGHLNSFFDTLGKNPEDIIPGYGLLDEMFKQIGEGTYYDELLVKLSNARAELDKGQEDLINASGTQIGESIKDNAELLEKIEDENQKLLDNAKAQTNAIEGVIDELDKLQKKWQEVINEITEMEGLRLNIDVSKTAKELNPTGLASGGYTGDWGSGGKLAVLHEKELVLNKSDTANMLGAMEILRVIVDRMAAAGSARANGLLDNIDMTGIKNAEIGAGEKVIDQKVTIEANFPAATDREEIQAAFDNLINLAAQKAGTNNRM